MPDHSGTTYAPGLPRDPLAVLPGVVEKLGYYVYALRDPRSGEIFYVGKGKGIACINTRSTQRGSTPPHPMS